MLKLVQLRYITIYIYIFNTLYGVSFLLVNFLCIFNNFNIFSRRFALLYTNPTCTSSFNINCSVKSANSVAAVESKPEQDEKSITT